MLLCTDSGKNYRIDLPSSVYILAHAWEQVQAITVQEWFRHAGFKAHKSIPHEGASIVDAEADAIFSQALCPFFATELLGTGCK